MFALAGHFWRLLPDVRTGERRRFVFFAGLSTLINLAQTVGFAGSEALFLAQFGAVRLPETFIAASLATVLGSLLYANRVGAERNDRLFIRMLLASGILLGGATVGILAGWVWVLPMLFCFFYVSEAIFLNHFWTFSGDYFDTVTSKRLVPLFTIGASVGGALGGLLTALLTEVVGAVSLISAWGAFLAAAALMLRVWRRQLRRWGPLELEEADETSVEGMQGAVSYLRTSSLGRWLVLSALGMVLALSVAQYLYSDIFARRFPTPGELAAFFGVYLAVTNLIEIGIEMGLTPRLIRRFGVPTAHLLHPCLTLLSFGGLASHYSLYSGVAARANRELVENAMAGPIRALVLNAMPLRYRGRMRAFLEGIVVYAGMSVAGLVILALGRPDPVWLCTAGACMAFLYLVANLGARREYLRALVGELRAGRLDLSDVGDEIGDWEASRLAKLWEQLLLDEGSRPSRSLLQLIPILAARGITDPLVRAASHPNPDVRRASIDGLATALEDEVVPPLLAALQDPDPGVRLAAVRGLSRPGGPCSDLERRLHHLVRDRDPQVRAEASLHAGAEGLRTLEEMIHSRDASEAAAALCAATPALLDAALSRVRDADAAVRAAALECIARVAPEPPFTEEELPQILRDPDARVRRAALLVLAHLGDTRAFSALASALSDPSPEVQSTAETVLTLSGEPGLKAVEPYLRDDRERAVEGALRVVAAGGTPHSRDVLYRELRYRVHELWYDVIAYQHLPADTGLAALFLRAAYEDDMIRSRRLAFRILELLEDRSVIRHVDKALRLASSRSRGNALEVLSNLGDRESAQLLVLIHDTAPLDEKIPSVTPFVLVPTEPREILDASRRSDARWIRMGAQAFDAGDPPHEVKIMERILALRQIPLFAQLSLEQLEAVHQITNEVEYLAGEMIVREGDPGGELYLLLEGSVRVFKNHGTPDQTLLSTLSAMSYFGEMAILDDEPRSATVVAAERARLLSLDGGSLKDLILQMPEISFEIFRVLTGRVRTAESRLGRR